MGRQVPEKFGKCTLKKPLGKGATAVVYLARHEGLDMPVAVKILRKALSRSRPAYAKRFLREARMAAWLEHPNIVRVIDCGIQDGYHYMVMDYVDGPNCLHMLRQREDGLEWREATDIIRQASLGLEYAAEHDVIHRDVKPSNIMIDSSGRARVTDLGLAKMTVKGVAELTQELQTVGTPNYMSPEQIRSASELDLRADIYSLGATYYHMVTGRAPFVSDTNMGVVAQHLTRPVVPPYKMKDGLPSGLSDLICKMMAKSPEERYQSYEALRGELEKLLQGEEVAAEGFEETHLDEEEDRRLAQMLLRLGTGPVVEMDTDEEEQEGRTESGAEEVVPQSGTGSTTIDLFEPAELRSYAPEPAGDSTIMSAPEDQSLPTSLVVGLLVVLGLLFLAGITLYGIFGG